MKTCTKCGETKALDEFGVRRNRPSGRNSACKECKVRAEKARYSVKKTEILAKQRQHRLENLDDYRRRGRAQDRRRQGADSRLLNSRIQNHKRRAAEVYLVTDRDYRRILESPCVACGSTKNIQVDHIIPIARGGRHCVGNLQALCGSCNASKGAKLPIAWRTRHSASGTPHAQGGRP